MHIFASHYVSCRRSCLLFVPVVSKLQWQRCAIVPDQHIHHQRMPINYIYLSRSYLNVRLCDTHMAYTIYIRM